MVLQCSLNAWLNGLASGESRRRSAAEARSRRSLYKSTVTLVYSKPHDDDDDDVKLHHYLV